MSSPEPRSGAPAPSTSTSQTGPAAIDPGLEAVDPGLAAVDPGLAAGNPGPVAVNRIRPVEAWRGIRALMEDPDDTAQVFRVIRALSGKSIEHGFQKFRSSESGRRILDEQRSLVARLSDRAALESLPEGSLGRVYADFTRAEKISADGLVDASMDAPQMGFDAQRQLFAERLRDMHDLWHVVTGYGRDLVGEAALLAFTYRQTRDRGIGFIVAVAYLRAGRRGMPQQRVMIRDGYRRSRSTAWLPAADWELLLERPLDEVRQTLGIEPVSDYADVRSVGAPSTAA